MLGHVRRLRPSAILVCAVFALLAFGAVAAAHTASSPTKVVVDEFTQTGSGETSQGHWVGHLKSPRKGCLRGRTVKLLLRNGNNDKTKLADTDHTGRRGRWTLDGDLFTIDRAQIKVTRKSIGSGDNRRICTRDTFTQFFA
jgi:hypothetical protein